MSKPTRLTIWLILISTALALLVIYFLCVPYITSVYYINRRTGDFSGHATYFGVFTRHFTGGRTVSGDLAQTGPYTGEDREIPFQIRTNRFMWSTTKEEYRQPGMGYYNACEVLFWSLRGDWPGKRTIPPDELDAIIKRRILIWNSAELDRDPQAIADQARKENEEFRALPVAPAK